MTLAPELYTINQLQKQVEILTEQNAELYRQLDEANAHAEAVRKQPRALLMHLDAACRYMNQRIEALEAALVVLGESVRDHNQVDALREAVAARLDLQTEVTRLNAWTQTPSKNGSNGHQE